ncbi:hypothetical protein LJC16_01505 [Bacteroidales bacterium OttesenSCG-928-C19]|nr:hypothetical protein [Bacteroidales bacterium OttesenSCG-928-C19]
MEDYYKILDVKFNASQYEITLHYKILAKKLILLNSEKIKIDFYQLNSAFEVLRNKQVRTYYDILYKILIENKQTTISNQTIEKYLSIVDSYVIKGKEKANRMIDNENLSSLTSIKRPLVLSFLIGTVKLYMRYPRFIASPLAGFGFLVVGIVFLFKDILGISADLWLIGLIFSFSGIISIVLNFRCFTIDLMNEQC